MSVTPESSSFLSNTLKRRQQKRQEVTKVLQEGISSLHLASSSSAEQQSNEGIYPLLNIDPDSYLLDEGDERSMLEPSSYHTPDFKQTRNALFGWLNSALSNDSIIVRSFEDDLYDGYILGKLIHFYQPNVQLLSEGLPLSEESKKKNLQRVLHYLESVLTQPVKWTFERIYHRDPIAILHLLLFLLKMFNRKIYDELPKTLFLKVVVVKKTSGILQTRIAHECFIDEHDRELTVSDTSKQSDLIDALFDLAPDKLVHVERTLLNFINSQLRHYNIQVKQIDLQYFQDGLNLLYLIAHLENSFIILSKYNRQNPITREQAYANLQLAFQLMNQAGIEIEQYCRIHDLLAGNQRTLYRVLFQLYLRYNSDSNNLLQSITYLQPVRTNVDSPFL